MNKKIKIGDLVRWVRFRDQIGLVTSIEKEAPFANVMMNHSGKIVRLKKTALIHLKGGK